MSQLIEARIREIGDAAYQNRRGIDSSASRLMADLNNRKTALDSLQAEIESDPDLSAEQKASLMGDVNTVRQHLVDKIDATYPTFNSLKAILLSQITA